MIVFVGGSIGLMFFSQFFAIKNIKLARKDFRVDSEAIAYTVQDFRNRNIFLLPKKELVEKIGAAHPYVQSIEINKELPRTLVLTLGTYPIVAKWKIHIKKEDLLNPAKAPEEAEQTLFINQVGMVSKGSEGDEAVFLIEEQDDYEDFLQENAVIATGAFLQDILNARQLIEEVLGKPVAKAVYLRQAQEIHYILENETELWIDFATPQEKQINKLNYLLKETDILEKSLHHLDLRIQGRVYWEERK